MIITDPRSQVAVNLRILFEEAVQLVPSGITQGEEAHHWELFITEKMLDRVVTVLQAKDERIATLEKAIEKIKKTTASQPRLMSYLRCICKEALKPALT